MLRRLSTLASAVSLVLCLATCVLWVRSYWVADMVFRAEPLDRGPTGAVAITYARSERGGVQATNSAEGDDADFPPFGTCQLPSNAYAGGEAAHRWGFAATLVEGGEWWLVFPHACPALLAAILPAGWLWRTVSRRHSRRDGLCPACGYDLRATPGQCPECGAEPKGGTA